MVSFFTKHQKAVAKLLFAAVFIVLFDIFFVLFGTSGSTAAIDTYTEMPKQPLFLQIYVSVGEYLLAVSGHIINIFFLDYSGFVVVFFNFLNSVLVVGALAIVTIVTKTKAKKLTIDGLRGKGI